MISATKVADSICTSTNKRITTMEVVGPRIILAEFNTHRMLSRNSASSRAIPFKRMLSMVMSNPFIPIAWMKDHKGMQGTEYFTNVFVCFLLKQLWLTARNVAVVIAWTLSKFGLTKQFCNRLLEPFMWHKIIVTATEWENFFTLRCPQYQIDIGDDKEPASYKYRSRIDAMKALKIKSPLHEKFWRGANKGAAEIHMMALAEAMWDAMNSSNPQPLLPGEWHIPYADKINMLDRLDLFTPLDIVTMKLKVSTVMCARVSYTTIDTDMSEWNIDRYLKKHDELVVQDPLHASPLEHCAEAQPDLRSSGNFIGWRQYRKTFPNENIPG